MTRTRFAPSLFALALIAGCCVACDAGPGTAPPKPPDNMPPVVVGPNKVNEAPAKSGSDVRHLWVVTDGGARVKESDTVYAEKLAAQYGQPVYCSFGTFHGAGIERTCYPQYPSAVVDETGAVYADANCTDDKRIVQEQEAQRICSPGKLLFVVLALPTMNLCEQAITVRELTEIPIPTGTWTLSNGRCVPDQAGRAGIKYYVTGRILDKSELPHGKLSVE